MTFAQPAWLWLLPGVLPLILLLHARRRRDVVVPSLVVWRRVRSADVPAPSRRSFPWRDPLLWLQLLAAAALVLSLARPVLGGAASAHWIVLMDASLSMNATDVEPNRFDVARRTVVDRWGGRGAGGNVSLISVGPTARLIAVAWPAGTDLRLALDGMAPSAGTADWPGAASRAAAIAAEDSGARVAVVTDGFGAPTALAALEAAGFTEGSVAVVSVGSELANVGIGGVTVEPRASRPDQWTVGGSVVSSGFAKGDIVRVVASFRPPGNSIFLPWGAEEVVVGADGTGRFAIPLDLPGPGEVEVRGPTGDHLAADDAVVVSLRADPVRVAIVGTAHPALLRALASVGGLEVYSAAAVPAPAEAALFDLVIVSGAGTGVPITSTLWLGAVPDGAGAGAGATITVAEGDLAARPHPLTADLDASAVSIAGAVPLVLPEGATPLLVSGDDVLAWARTTTSGRQVVVGFALDDTDWASQVSFPAFVAALVDWSAPRSWSHDAGACRVGEACEWPREAFAGDWELLDPNGAAVRDVPVPEPLEGDPMAEGVWFGPRLDAGFTPTLAGSYTLLTSDGPVPLPVVATPLGGEPGDLQRATALAGPGVTALWRWLAALAALALATEALLALLRQRRVVRRRWRGPLALASLALGAVVLGILGAQLPGYGARGKAIWVGREAPPAVVTGAGRDWEWVMRRPASIVEDDGTLSNSRDLASSIEYALAQPRKSGELHVVVSVDGTDGLDVQETGRLAGAAATDGTSIDVVVAAETTVVTPQDPAALEVRALSLPERVRAGSRFALTVDVSAADGVDWRLEATLTATTGEVREGAPEPSSATSGSGSGAGRAELQLQAGGKGELVYQLALFAAGSKAPVSETSVSVPVGPPPAVLLVAVDDSRGSVLASALETQGLTVDRATPFRMPGTLERLAAYDAVLLADVSATDMFPEYQTLLERYVRESGGGLAIVGGTSSFGPGGYYATPLEDVSPLSSRITDEAPEVAMVFVLDRSGSMSGPVAGSTRMAVAKAATLEAIGLLGERSLAAIVVFDTEARVVLPLTPVSDEGAFRAALASITAAGGTSIYPGLVSAYRLMSDSTSATRHVVVMTDGLSQEGDFAGVLKALTEEGVSTSFVGVGDAADRRQLTTLAALSGGTLHMALDFRALPSLLAQEALMLAATPIEEGTVTPRWAEGSAPEFLTDVSSTPIPPLAGYIKTTLKDEASVHAFVGNDDPLLASWRYGLGRVVAFASDADGKWSRAWTRSAEFGQLWAQLMRWAAERPVREPWSLRLGRRGEVLDVVVDLPSEIPETALPMASVALPGGEVLARQRLERIGRSRAAASFEVDTSRAGQLTVGVSAAPELDLPAGLARTIAWPLPPGTQLRSDVVPVAGLAEATGGDVYESAAAVEPGPVSRALNWRSAPGAWLILAMIAFLASLAVRYGVVPRSPSRLRARSAARTRTA